MNGDDIGEINDELGQERPEKDYPWIVFALSGTEYGINSKYVLSIEILKKITPIVDAPCYCPGITESRGDMIDLLDLRVLLGLGNYLSAQPDKQDERIMMIVLELDGRKSGLIVDEIVSVEYITQLIEDAEGANDNWVTSQYIRQIARREKLDTPVLIVKPKNLSEL